MARKREEASHQKAFFQWLAYTHPEAYDLTWHCPNGGKRNAFEAARFKEIGVKPGVPDVFMAVASDSFHGLFIEFKSGRNGLTISQRDMLLKLLNQKYKVAVCHSVDAAIETVELYLMGRCVEN